MKTKKVTQHDGWEIKDRTYLLMNNQSPLTYRIPSKHTARQPLLWYDELKNEQREIRYATNQNSPFKDEQKGEATLGHIIFKDGALTVLKKNQALQKVLSLYHPLNKVKYRELDIVENAKDDLIDLELDTWADIPGDGIRPLIIESDIIGVLMPFRTDLQQLVRLVGMRG